MYVHTHHVWEKYVFCIRYCKSDLYVILKLLEYVIQKIYKTKQNKWKEKKKQSKQMKNKNENLWMSKNMKRICFNINSNS